MIELVTYKGEKYPIRISSYVLEMVQKEFNLKFDELGKIEGDIEMQKSVLWYALEAGHRISSKEFTLKREDISWILDECYFELQKALAHFGQSLIQLQEELIEEVNNKKK